MATDLSERVEFNLRIFDEYDEEIGQIKNALLEIIPEGVNISLYFNSRNAGSRNISEFRKDFISSYVYDVSFIHDRVWIKDRSSAKV